MKTKSRKKSKKPAKLKVRVTIVAHDSWNGPEVLEVKEFATQKGAEGFCKKFNAKNNLPYVPEYYETATIGDGGYGFSR